MSMKKVPRMITRASSEPSGSSDGALGQNKACFAIAFSIMNYANDSVFSYSGIISLEKFHSVILIRSMSSFVLGHLNDLMLMQTPFGYTRKDVILIGVGVTLLGVGLKSGLEVLR